jgi:hypothetical protein
MACRCGCDRACGCRCCDPRGTDAATLMTCARRSPGWGPSVAAAARPPARGGAGGPVPGRPGLLRPGWRRAVPVVGILRAGVR